MSTSKGILEITGLIKRYRHIKALDGVDLSIGAGEFVGFIGPNGAGKTTTMRCIAGQLMPDEGEVRVGGQSVLTDPVSARRQVGYVPQELTLYRYLTGEEFLRFVADIRGVEAGVQDERVEELLTLTELQGARHRILREYSGGMSRKIAIAAALIARPPLLLLDESFVGLDPESTSALRKTMATYCQEGGAILLSSHILDMLERLCTRVVLLNGGRIQLDLTREELDGRLARGETLTSIYLEAIGKG